MQYRNVVTGLLALGSLMVSLAAYSDGGDKEGNGGDTVEVIFDRAKKDAYQKVRNLTRENLAQFKIDRSYQNWLLDTVEDTDRLSRFVYYAKKIAERSDYIRFIEGNCTEDSVVRPVCYEARNTTHPDHGVMVISRSMNRDQSTTETQAMALIFHEIGHFTGEKDHEFLSDLGVEMMQTPKLQVLVEISESRLWMGGRYPISSESDDNVDSACLYFGYHRAVNATQDCDYGRSIKAWHFTKSGEIYRIGVAPGCWLTSLTCIDE
mgnify:CR=1 FL=1